MTPQRRAVLDAVAAQDGAFAVMDVYDLARPVELSLGLATVYRTVELLRSTGFVQPLRGPATARMSAATPVTTITWCARCAGSSKTRHSAGARPPRCSPESMASPSRATS